MNISKVLTFLGVSLAVVLSVISIFKSGNQIPTPAPVSYGAAGSTFSSEVFLQNGETVGGYDFATSSRGVVTYTASSITRSRVIEHIATAATTGTLPTNAALSSLGFLQNVGDTKTLFIQASTTKITMAGNTGVTISSASTTLDISPGKIGRLDFVRLGATESGLIQVLLTTD